jgi:hypothetical protein
MNNCQQVKGKKAHTPECCKVIVVFTKVAVQCSPDTIAVKQTWFSRTNICGENRHLRKALTVAANFKNDDKTINRLF